MQYAEVIIYFSFVHISPGDLRDSMGFGKAGFDMMNGYLLEACFQSGRERLGR